MGPVLIGKHNDNECQRLSSLPPYLSHVLPSSHSMTIILKMELPGGNCPSPRPPRRGQMPLAYPRPTHSMSLRSHGWVPPHPESPATPGTSIFERAMRRSNYARGMSPLGDVT